MDFVCLARNVRTCGKNKNETTWFRPYFCILNFTMIRTFSTPILENILNLLIEPSSLVTITAPYFFLWYFGPQDPFHKRRLGTFKIIPQTSSSSPKLVEVSQMSNFERAAESEAGVTSPCLRVRYGFLRQIVVRGND